MALFQPTNVIPSSFTVGVVDAANDTAQISWQVNGNSAMTAYKIDFYSNNDFSTPYADASTGKISDGIPTGGFYGTDRFGQPKMFTWTANGGKTWNAYNEAFTNGREFKFKITQYWQEGGVEKSIEQIESTVFATRTRPSLNIQRSGNENFTNATPFPSGSTLPASVGYFVGDYSQAQGAPVREARWQIATWTNGAEGEILADTGDVDTPTLQFSFNGFFIGNEYAVRCSGKADYQTYGTQDFDSGWVHFTANAEEQGKYVSNLTVSCSNRENTVLLKWENSGIIPPKFSPEEYVPVISGGSVTLDPNSSIRWDHEIVYDEAEKKNSEAPMQYSPPWTVVLKMEPLKEDRTEKQTVSGISSEIIRSPSQSVSRQPDSFPEVEGSYYIANFTFYPGAKYAKVLLSYPISIQIRGGTLARYTEKSNPDGSLTITTTSIGRPDLATVSVAYVGYSYTDSIISKGGILNYSVSNIGSSTKGYEIEEASDNSLKVTLYGKSEGANVSAVLSLNYQIFTTTGTLLEIGGSGQTLKLNGSEVELYNGEELLGKTEISPLVSSIVAIIAPEKLQVLSYKAGNGMVRTTQVAYTQKAVEALTIFGGDAGVIVNSVSVFQGDGSNIVSFYQNDLSFEPVWNDDSYKLYLSANFDNGIFDGGIGTSVSIGFKIYRQEVGSDILTPIAVLPSTVTALKDYGIRSRKSYKYSIYAYDSNQAFMQSVENDIVVSTCFKSYSLLVCDYDSVNDAYHVRKQYLFALNLSAGSEGNNNTPTLSANFTPYPTRMPSTQNYASGTLQGLIGVIYTVPALVEEINGYKHTAKPSTMDYFDSVDLEKELKDLSVTPYTLFMRDMKGHLRMVATSNQISMTPDLKKRQIPLTMSFPWVEIGDAGDVTIIQTPQDEGWGDRETLDVGLNYDEEIGAFSSQYPKPYTGTKFYLTGTKGTMRRG